MSAKAVLSSRVMSNAHRDTFYLRVGERIREVREHAGLSQMALARLAGLNSTTISNAESGQTCSLYILAILAENLDGVTLDDLVPMSALDGDP